MEGFALNMEPLIEEVEPTHIANPKVEYVRGLLMEGEIDQLREKLMSAQQALESTREEMHVQKMRTRQLVMTWKHRLQQKEDKIRRERIRRDQELQEISQQLLFFEGQLRQEQHQIKTTLFEKDHVIDIQNQRITELMDANNRLNKAIESVKVRLKTGEQIDKSACSSSSMDFYLGDNLDSDVFFEDVDDQLAADYSKSDISMSSLLSSSKGASTISQCSAKSRVLTSSPIYRCKSLPECRLEKSGLVEFSYEESEQYDKSPSIPRTKSQDLLEERVTEFFASNATDSEKERRLIYSAAAKQGTPANGKTALTRNNMTGCFGSTPDILEHKKIVPINTATQMVEKTPKKSSFLKPRDVKKRSMEKARSSSLKDEAQPLHRQKSSFTKRYFSFAF